MSDTNTDDSETDVSPTTTSDYPSGYDHVKDITRPLNELRNGGYNGWRVFQDWVDLMLTALMGDDEAYLDVADEYGPEELNLFVEAFAALRLATMEHEVDVVGDVYEALGMNSKNFAQHFTPHSVSEGMSDMQTEVSEDDDPIRVLDPACGSGRLLVAASKRVEEDEAALFVGQDKDEVCAKMTALNFCLFGINGYVAHGDTLTMDVYQAWQTQDGKVRETDPNPLEEHLEGAVSP